jgi:RHS repeat-associated protein
MEANYTGTLAEGISTTMYNGTQGYDKNGNIGYLKRTTNAGATVMDQLIYSYSANQLTAVADGGDISKGFKDKVNTTDYTYDQAGNMITDANKDLSIAYNHLNLPATITRTTAVGSSGAENNGVIKHYYAGATKVRMETYDAAGTTLLKAYDYLAGMVYQETVVANVSTKELDFVASPEGRALLTKKVLNLPTEPTSGDKFRFEYSLKDHLGNLRVSCRCGEPKRDAQGIIIPEGQPGTGIETLAVVQEQHYDAWGLAFNAVSSSVAENLKDKFTYNGKEQINDLDLGWNDYGARMYMSELGRWNGNDVLAERYISYSTYNFVFNSPLVFKDPNGMSVTSFLNEIWNQSGSSSTWINNEDGTFSNDKGKKVNSENHVIDFFKDTEKNGSSFKQTIANWKTGDKENIFYLFGHGNSRKIIYGAKDIFTAEDLNKYLAQESPEWKKAIQEGRKVTLIIFACNTGSYSFMQHSDDPANNNKLITNAEPFAQKVSKSGLFENVTIIAPQAYVNFSKGRISSFTNTGGDPNMQIFFRGELISTLQQR